MSSSTALMSMLQAYSIDYPVEQYVISPRDKLCSKIFSSDMYRVGFKAQWSILGVSGYLRRSKVGATQVGLQID